MLEISNQNKKLIEWEREERNCFDLLGNLGNGVLLMDQRGTMSFLDLEDKDRCKQDQSPLQEWEPATLIDLLPTKISKNVLST